MDRTAARRDRLRRHLRKAGVDSLLVTSYVNVTYLTGFTGDDSYLLITPKHQVLLTDPRYTTQLAEECPGLDLHVRQPGVTMLEAIEQTVKASKVSRLGIESDSMTVGLRDRIAERLPRLELVALEHAVEDLRVTKDKEEVAEIRSAVAQAERAFAVIRASLRGEQTEKEVADNLEHQMRQFGAKAASFTPIVAVGPRSALPHARPTQQRIGEGDFVLIDWGADGGLYKSG
jgi:Xaa-Pro aminopeptidase